MPKCKSICHKYSKYDLLCLLDTHLDEKTEANLTKFWKGECRFAHNTSSIHTGGIALLFGQNITPKILRRDVYGRYIFIEINFQNKSFVLVFVYAPASSEKLRSDLFDLVRKELVQFSRNDTKFIILGDFNCVESPSLDRSTGIPPKDNSFINLSQLCETFDLHDLWRERNPTLREFTFFPENGNVSSRLDRIYTPTALSTIFSKIEHKSCAFSDHSAKNPLGSSTSPYLRTKLLSER